MLKTLIQTIVELWQVSEHDLKNVGLSDGIASNFIILLFQTLKEHLN